MRCFFDGRLGRLVCSKLFGVSAQSEQMVIIFRGKQMPIFDQVTVIGTESGTTGYTTESADGRTIIIGAEFNGSSIGVRGSCGDSWPGPGSRDPESSRYGVHGIGYEAGVYGESASDYACPGVQGVGSGGCVGQPPNGGGPGVFGQGGAGNDGIEGGAGVVGFASDVDLSKVPLPEGQSYGGVFASVTRAQVRLVPFPSTSPNPNGTVKGMTGDLLAIDNNAGDGSLWFCSRGGDPLTAKWKQIA
jgi:hypothetical protein